MKQSQDRILEPLPPSEASLWDSRSASRERGQVVSITDAIADMLGYVLPDMVRSQRGRKLEGSNVTSSTKAKPKIEGVARRNAEDGVSFNDIADDDFESDNLGGAKVSPMEVGSWGVDDRKPAAVPSRSSSGAKSHDDLAFLDDSGDDESIPDAVVFKKAT